MKKRTSEEMQESYDAACGQLAEYLSEGGGPGRLLSFPLNVL